MPETATKRYDQMSTEELKARAAELRSDMVDTLSHDERDDDRLRSVSYEMQAVDTLYSHHLNVEQKEREAAAIAALEERLNEYPPPGSTGPRGAGISPVTDGYRSIGEIVGLDDALMDWARGGFVTEVGNPNSHRSFTFDQTTVDGSGYRTLTEFAAGGPGNAPTTAINSLLPVAQPLAPAPRQGRLFMRDLMPVVPVQVAQIPYVRELNPLSLEQGASAVGEGNVKPDVSSNFQPDVANITVLAANISPSKQLWEDAPVIVNYFNQRLPYLVRFAEDAAFLNGSGTWPMIKGILQFSGQGLQTDAGVAGQTAISIAHGIAKVEGADGAASAVVMNHNDAWNMFALRAAGGSGTFDAGVPFALNTPTALTVWGLPTVRTRVKAAGTALVGDFRNGGAILDRQQLNLQVYPQHSDYPARNLLLVQVEERVGVMWPRPDLFCNVTIS